MELLSGYRVSVLIQVLRASCSFRRATPTRSSCFRISSSEIITACIRGCSGFMNAMAFLVSSAFVELWPCTPAFSICSAVATDCSTVCSLTLGPTVLMVFGSVMSSNSSPLSWQARKRSNRFSQNNCLGFSWPPCLASCFTLLGS